jgi:hypothetical protein
MCLTSFRRASLVLAAGLLLPAAAAAQIPTGQTDTFENGTPQGWQNGGLKGSGGVSVQLGGPAGAADHYLRVQSGQVNTPPRLIIFNRAQWAGNYNPPFPRWLYRFGMAFAHISRKTQRFRRLPAETTEEPKG